MSFQAAAAALQLRRGVLTSGQRHVLLVVASYAGATDDQMFAGIERIADDTGMTRRGVQLALKKLRELKFIVEERPAENHFPATYRVDLELLTENARAPQPRKRGRARGERRSPHAEVAPAKPSPAAPAAAEPARGERRSPQDAPARGERRSAQGRTTTHPRGERRSPNRVGELLEEPSARARAGARGGGDGGLSRDGLVQVAKGFRIAQLPAELLIDGALRDLTLAEVASEISAVMGRTADALKRRLREACDAAGRVKTAEAERALKPLMDRIRHLDSRERDRLLDRINVARAVTGDDRKGDFYASQDRWLAEQMLTHGLHLEEEDA